jgi:hypothetical protein
VEVSYGKDYKVKGFYGMVVEGYYGKEMGFYGKEVDFYGREVGFYGREVKGFYCKEG